MIVGFRDYRLFEEARVAANDASMALLVGSQIAIEALHKASPPPNELLPAVFPHLPQMRYMTLNTAQSIELLETSERYLAYMAIPFVVSVHATLIHAALRMLQDADLWPAGRAPEKIEFDAMHEEVFRACGKPPEGGPTNPLVRDLSLFDFIRLVRNRIVHSGGRSGQSVRQRWKALAAPEQREWIGLAERAFEAHDGAPLPLQRGELIAVLAVTRRLAEAVNDALAATIPREHWAKVAVEDYAKTNPHRWPNRARRLERVIGHARFYYGPLKLTREELEGALAAVEAAT